MEQERGWLPRNLIQSDVIKLGFGIKVRLEDFPFLSGGGIISYLVNYSSGNTVITVLSSAAIMVTSYGLSKIKKEGQTSSELVKNSAIYSTRQLYYVRKRRQKNDKVYESKLHKHIISKFKRSKPSAPEFLEDVKVA